MILDKNKLQANNKSCISDVKLDVKKYINKEAYKTAFGRFGEFVRFRGFEIVDMHNNTIAVLENNQIVLIEDSSVLDVSFNKNNEGEKPK